MNEQTNFLREKNIFELKPDYLIEIIERHFGKTIPLIKEGKKSGWLFYNPIKESKRETVSYLQKKLFELSKEEIGDLIDFQFLAKKNKIGHELRFHLYLKDRLIKDLLQFDIEYLFFTKIAKDKNIKRDYFKKGGETNEEGFKRWLVDIKKYSLEEIKLSNSIKELVTDYRSLFSETFNLISKICYPKDYKRKLEKPLRGKINNYAFWSGIN